MDRRKFVTAAGTALSLGVAGCTGGGGTNSAPFSISISEPSILEQDYVDDLVYVEVTLTPEGDMDKWPEFSPNGRTYYGYLPKISEGQDGDIKDATILYKNDAGDWQTTDTWIFGKAEFENDHEETERIVLGTPSSVDPGTTFVLYVENPETGEFIELESFTYESAAAETDADDEEGTTETATQSATMEVVDDFEDANFPEYTGDTSFVSQSTATVKEGSGSLQLHTDGEGRSIFRTDAAPTQGDIIEVWVQNNVNFANFLFGVEENDVDAGTWYQAGFTVNGDKAFVSKVKDGSGVKRDRQNVQLNEGEWYRWVIEWNANGSDQIVATIYDASGTQLAQMAISDTEYTAQACGFHANEWNTASGNTYWDTLRKSTTWQ